jgi:chitinase
MVSLLPHGWIDDTLLDERKAGLNEFLCLILNTEKTKGHPLLSAFFKTPFASCFALESLGEGLTQLALARPAARRQLVKQEKKGNSGEAGTPIVASYYPSWAASTLPPESVDWNKFDIVFFGKRRLRLSLIEF